jgi:hypothetical protein
MMNMNSTKGSVRARLLTSTLLAGLASIATPLAITAVATAIPTIASAQQTGGLRIVVTGASGSPLSGANVVVRSPDSLVSKSAVTDNDGRARSAAPC